MVGTHARGPPNRSASCGTPYDPSARPPAAPTTPMGRSDHSGQAIADVDRQGCREQSGVGPMSDSFAMARARRALAEAGLDYHMPLRRADSVTNEVWVADDYVVRVNRHPNQRLRREALLGPLLPEDVGYPEVIGYGGVLGADWLVLRRCPGLVLSRCWPTMSVGGARAGDPRARRRMRSIHQTECPPDVPGSIPPSSSAAGSVSRLSTRCCPSSPRWRSTSSSTLVSSRRPARSSRPPRRTSSRANPTTLIHGDLHFENVLWDGQDITALLDFEYARAGPPDLELDVFLRFCAYPFLHVAEDYEHLTRAEDYADGPVLGGRGLPRAVRPPTTCSTASGSTASPTTSATCCCSRPIGRRGRSPSTTPTTAWTGSCGASAT